MDSLRRGSPPPATAYGAVVLAGGAGRRLGGVHKPLLPVGGVPMLTRVLAAVADACPRVVVGPPHPVPAGVVVTREEPPGGGPVSATAAGLAALPDDIAVVALLAADLPLLTTAAVMELRRVLEAAVGADGAMYVDRDSRRQLLCGVWRVAALRQRLAVFPSPAGAAMRALLSDLTVVEVGSTATADSDAPPWFDCDTVSAVDTANAVADERLR